MPCLHLPLQLELLTRGQSVNGASKYLYDPMCWSVGYAQARGRGEGFVMYPCAVAVENMDARSKSTTGRGEGFVMRPFAVPVASIDARSNRSIRFNPVMFCQRLPRRRIRDMSSLGAGAHKASACAVLPRFWAPSLAAGPGSLFELLLYHIQKANRNKKGSGQPGPAGGEAWQRSVKERRHSKGRH
eukprot:scaffold3499_cov117-Isochrysis_galbana.AAC.2